MADYDELSLYKMLMNKERSGTEQKSGNPFAGPLGMLLGGSASSNPFAGPLYSALGLGRDDRSDQTPQGNQPDPGSTTAPPGSTAYGYDPGWMAMFGGLSGGLGG